jgi:hypothetical protein
MGREVLPPKGSTISPKQHHLLGGSVSNHLHLRWASPIQATIQLMLGHTEAQNIFSSIPQHSYQETSQRTSKVLYFQSLFEENKFPKQIFLAKPAPRALRWHLSLSWGQDLQSVRHVEGSPGHQHICPTWLPSHGNEHSIQRVGEVNDKSKKQPGSINRTGEPAHAALISSKRKSMG